MDPGKSIVAIKNVTYNEPFFQGHFAHHPVMPGVLIIEALAQAAALFSFADAGAPNLASTKIAYYLVGVDGARFRRPVVPGDQLRMEVSADKLSRSICKYTAVAKVDDQIAAEAKIMCAVRILEE
jgi:3-hydroxyacyl-[acyl-carrier-protein] dehydratase